MVRGRGRELRPRPAWLSVRELGEVIRRSGPAGVFSPRAEGPRHHVGQPACHGTTIRDRRGPDHDERNPGGRAGWGEGFQRRLLEPVPLFGRGIDPEDGQPVPVLRLRGGEHILHGVVAVGALAGIEKHDPDRRVSLPIGTIGPGRGDL